MKLLYRDGLGGLLAIVLGLLSSNAARADIILVTNEGADTVGAYTTSGATVNASLITGLDNPVAIAVSGSDVFVVNAGSRTIGEYTTSGATVNASLIPMVPLKPNAIAVSGSNLFVTQNCLSVASCAPIVGGTIGKYTTAGGTVNTALVPSYPDSLVDAFGIAVSGSDMFVSFFGGSTISEFTTGGATVNASLITFADGLSAPDGIAIDGSDLFVANFGSNTIGEYTTSGATVNASLVTGSNNPEGIAIVPTAAPVPEPSSLMPLGLDLAGLGFCWRKRAIGS